MDNLIYSLNATVPIFLLMVLGMVLRRLDIISEGFANDLNSFVFKIALPVMLFNQLADVEIYECWDGRFVLFCFFVTLGVIFLTVALSFLIKDRNSQGEWIQAAFRSNTTLLGIALINNIYGESVAGSLMIIGCVPLSNTMSVIVLSLFREQSTLNSSLIKETFKDIINNPIIIGILIGLLWSLLGIPYPSIIDKSVTYISNMASPLGLLAMGALFDVKEAQGALKESIFASFLRLVVYVVIFMPMAIMLGFRNAQLIAILIILGASSAISSFTMARNMGYSGIISSNTIMITTLLCGFSITFWIFLLRCLGFI